ncbi:hypothetical protein BHE74_00053176, partial [Ensete ventricosum]
GGKGGSRRKKEKNGEENERVREEEETRWRRRKRKSKGRGRSGCRGGGLLRGRRKRGGRRDGKVGGGGGRGVVRRRSELDEESCVRKGHLHGHAPNRLLSGILQTGWPVVFGLSCRQSPTIRGATSWSTCRIWSATLPAPYWQGCRRLAGPLRLLCPVVGQLSIGVLPCYRLLVVRLTWGAVGLLWLGRMLWSFQSDIVRDERLNLIWLVAIEVCRSSAARQIAARKSSLDPTGLMVDEIRNSNTIGLLVAEIHNSGTIGLMVVEICNSGTIGLMVAEICNSGTTGLIVAEIHNSRTTRPTMVEICNSGTMGLMVAEIRNSGTTRFMVAKIRNSGTTGLMVTEIRNSGTTGLMVAEIRNSATIGRMVDEIHLCMTRICGSKGLGAKVT